jgi:pimeloyl-ACP methyl ester carboxylesterase
LTRFGAIYGVFCLGAFLFQRALIFFPTHRTAPTGLVPWLSGGQTIGFCREVDAPQTVWLMMHGNAGQASDRDYVLEHLSAQDALYVLEYPGYGSRGGSPSKASIDTAASDAYRALRQRFPEVPLCVIGESIGSGPASVLAQERLPPEKIVLITPFDTLHRVASRRFFFLPVGWLLLDRWDNMAALQHYQGPVDIFGAREDAVIPIGHARNLARACSRARFTEISGGHNDWSYSQAVRIER